MRRLYAAVIAAGCLALAWAATSPQFNARLSSPTLVHTLAPDYIAVDALYGGVTNPYALDAALHRQDSPTAGLVGAVGRPDYSYSSGITVTRAADGIHYARLAQSAVVALGSTAELTPIRQELLQSYRDVEQAWRSERYVEQAVANDGAAAETGILAEAPSVQSAADNSISAIRQARSLHDQAMAAVQALGGISASGTAPNQANSRQTAGAYRDTYHP
jgi:hypothetical protein